MKRQVQGIKAEMQHQVHYADQLTREVPRFASLLNLYRIVRNLRKHIQIGTQLNELKQQLATDRTDFEEAENEHLNRILRMQKEHQEKTDDLVKENHALHTKVQGLELQLENSADVNKVSCNFE